MAAIAMQCAAMHPCFKYPLINLMFISYSAQKCFMGAVEMLFLGLALEIHGCTTARVVSSEISSGIFPEK